MSIGTKLNALISWTLHRGLLRSQLQRLRLKRDAVPKYSNAKCLKATFKQTIENSSYAVIQEIPSCHHQEIKWKYKQVRKITAYGFIKPSFNIKSNLQRKLFFHLLRPMQ